MQLAPCRQCRRHIVTGGAPCPFCGTESASVITRVLEHGGRLSRAAVFAGLAACYTNANTHETTTVTGTGSGATFAQPPVDDPKPAPGTGTIVGIVRDGSSGSPSPNTMVMLRSDNDRSEQNASADANGRYVFANVPPGIYTISTMGNGNPRQMPPMSQASVKDGEVSHVDVTTEVYIPDTGPCCKPYGAPPARRRVV